MLWPHCRSRYTCRTAKAQTSLFHLHSHLPSSNAGLRGCTESQRRSTYTRCCRHLLGAFPTSTIPTATSSLFCDSNTSCVTGLLPAACVQAGEWLSGKVRQCRCTCDTKPPSLQGHLDKAGTHLLKDILEKGTSRTKTHFQQGLRQLHEKLFSFPSVALFIVDKSSGTGSLSKELSVHSGLLPGRKNSSRVS